MLAISDSKRILDRVSPRWDTDIPAAISVRDILLLQYLSVQYMNIFLSSEYLDLLLNMSCPLTLETVEAIFNISSKSKLLLSFESS